MTFFKRFLVLFICGAVQVFFASYLLLELLGVSLAWHLMNHDIMFIPGILVFLGSGYLTLSYYFLSDEQSNNALYDEFTALRYYKLATAGYVINGIGIFVLFSVQDWQNWSFELANNMIYQIAAFAWLIFGMLLVWFSMGDYGNQKVGKSHEKLLNNLEELRKAANLTQQELSESAEVSRKSINAIENGIYVPSTVLALKIAKTLDCSVEEIFKLP